MLGGMLLHVISPDLPIDCLGYWCFLGYQGGEGGGERFRGGGGRNLAS